MLKWTNKEINPSDNKKPVRITERIRSDLSEKAYFHSLNILTVSKKGILQLEYNDQ